MHAKLGRMLLQILTTYELLMKQMSPTWNLYSVIVNIVDIRTLHDLLTVNTMKSDSLSLSVP